MIILLPYMWIPVEIRINLAGRCLIKVAEPQIILCKGNVISYDGKINWDLLVILHLV